MRTFGVESKTLIILGITTYLCGLALGSLLLAPLSEMYGRRPVYLIAVAVFTILIIPCALSNNLPQILVMRFFGAIAGAAMISNAPGTVSDIVSDDYRALAFSIWSLGPMNGPVVGPLVGGFVFQALGWRWTNWVVMIGSGTSWFMVFRKYRALHLHHSPANSSSNQRNLRPCNSPFQVREEAQRDIRPPIPLPLRREESLLVPPPREPLPPAQHGRQRAHLHILGRVHCPRLRRLIPLLRQLPYCLWRVTGLVAWTCGAGIHGHRYWRMLHDSIGAVAAKDDQCA
jgi:multidrug resistance protein